VNTDTTQSVWPAILSLIVALMLAIIPLPGWIEIWRPDWAALTLIFWSLALPRRISLGSAWITGLALDTLRGALLGQHAIGLTVISYFTVKFHLRLRVFPQGQQSMTVAMLIGVYHFILFWIDGVAGQTEMSVGRFAPVLSSALIWPLWAKLLANTQRPDAVP